MKEEKQKSQKFENRFYQGTSIVAGYYRIKDRQDDDNIFWIDCKYGYLQTIIDALNSIADKKVS